MRSAIPLHHQHLQCDEQLTHPHYSDLQLHLAQNVQQKWLHLLKLPDPLLHPAFVEPLYHSSTCNTGFTLFKELRFVACNHCSCKAENIKA